MSYRPGPVGRHSWGFRLTEWGMHGGGKPRAPKRVTGRRPGPHNASLPSFRMLIQRGFGSNPWYKPGGHH